MYPFQLTIVPQNIIKNSEPGIVQLFRPFVNARMSVALIKNATNVKHKPVDRNIFIWAN